MSVHFEMRDHVGIVTLDRPSARNAIDNATTVAIDAAVTAIERDAECRVGVITGSPIFCSGMDLKAFLRGETVVLPGSGFAGFTSRRCRKPFIAAVEGYALAGGFEIALACDMIVAAENAGFGLPEAKLGLVAAAGGLVRLPRQLPPKVASEMVLTGDSYPASMLFGYGIVNRLAAPGAALETALDLAQKIAANGPLAIMASKQVMADSREWPDADIFVRQASIVDPVFASSDAREGATAFAEKRKPVWTGR